LLSGWVPWFSKKAGHLALHQLLTHSNVGEFTNEPKNAQEPQNHDNDYDTIQDRLNGSRHGNVIVDEPEKNTNYD
jgi:hypothetical protein